MFDATPLYLGGGPGWVAGGGPQPAYSGGRIDEFRIRIGSGGHTAPYTPPLIPWT